MEGSSASFIMVGLYLESTSRESPEESLRVDMMDGKCDAVNPSMATDRLPLPLTPLGPDEGRQVLEQ
jgi:hypothetical protein